MKRIDKWGPHPPADRCCICWEALDPVFAVKEERYTGELGDAEIWPYCSHCWDEMVTLRDTGKLPGEASDFRIPVLQTVFDQGSPAAPTTRSVNCDNLLVFIAAALDLDAEVSFLLHLDTCRTCKDALYRFKKGAATGRRYVGMARSSFPEKTVHVG